jgi:GMP synthase (glutamine-hydrolysing)
MPEPRPWGVVPGGGGPGLVATVARLRGIELRSHRPARGKLPDARGLGALVVHGGARGASGLVAQAIDEDVPVLAIGLGARLLAATLGAAVRPGAGGRACVAPVYLTDDGCVDRVLGEAPSRLDVMHRRRGTFDLPDGATALAASPVDPAPAFRFRRAYGLPFHLEIDAEIAQRWAGCPPGVPSSASLRAGIAVFDAFARLALAAGTVSRRSPTSHLTP